MEYDVQRCNRTCAKTGHELVPGQTIYSALVAEGAELVRYDYSVEGWEGPPEGALACWRSRIAMAESKKSWAPNDVMLDLLEQLEDQPDKQDMRYVLALLLVRRRVVRLEETVENESTVQSQLLFCPRRDRQYTVRVMMPEDSRAQEIQDELTRLLSVGAA